MKSEEMIRAVLDAHPELSHAGLAYWRDPNFQEGREFLLSQAGVAEFEVALDWLSRVRKVKRARFSSYYLKHAVEAWAGKYIGNGALIAAAYHLGFVVERPARSSINAAIGVSLRGWPEPGADIVGRAA